MTEAFSRTLRGAPFSSARFKQAAMHTAVQDTLRANGLSFTRGTVEAQGIIHEISCLATGQRSSRATKPQSPVVTHAMMVSMTIKIAKACKAIYGNTKVLAPDSLRRIALGLAHILRNEGRYCVTWTEEPPTNWQHELAQFEKEHERKPHT